MIRFTAGLVLGTVVTQLFVEMTNYRASHFSGPVLFGSGFGLCFLIFSLFLFGRFMGKRNNTYGSTAYQPEMVGKANATAPIIVVPKQTQTQPQTHLNQNGFDVSGVIEVWDQE